MRKLRHADVALLCNLGLMDTTATDLFLTVADCDETVTDCHEIGQFDFGSLNWHLVTSGQRTF